MSDSGGIICEILRMSGQERVICGGIDQLDGVSLRCFDVHVCLM